MNCSKAGCGVSRRDFLTGLGGLVAVGALSGCRATDPFARRGKYERLSLVCRHVDAGATRPFSLLHITDTHLTAAYDREPEAVRKLRDWRTRTFGGHQEEALADSLAWARKNCDYVLHTGDLIDWPSEANFDLVRKYFCGSICGSLGNHEIGWPRTPLNGKEKGLTEAMMREEWYGPLAKAYPFDLELQSTVVNGVNFVTVDDVFGTISERQRERLEKEFARGLPVVLAKHVPFVTEGILRHHGKIWFDWKLSCAKFTSAAIPPPQGEYARQKEDKVTADTIAWLRAEPRLKAILAGHEHFAYEERFSPTAMQFVTGGNFMFHASEVTFA